MRTTTSSSTKNRQQGSSKMYISLLLAASSLLVSAASAALDISNLPSDHPAAIVQQVSDEARKKGEDERIHNEDLDSPACQSQDEVDALFTKYHDDSVCNRAAFHSYKENLQRLGKYNYFRATPELHSRVPDRTTVTCPMTVQDLTIPNQETGYDTDFIIENKASSPIVLSWVHPETLQESSAVHTNLAIGRDPAAILQPNQWKYLHSYEGHVFHARELLPDGTPGAVLLQHRAGLIPVGKNAANSLICSLHDPEPIVVIAGMKQNPPAFQRTPQPKLRECNQMSFGFRNHAGCPLHGYFVRANSCKEVYKLHLGVNTAPNDFHWGWDSATKFESSFIGHTFVFRSSSDDSSRIIDRVDITPIQVVDCPDLKNQVNMLPVAVAVEPVRSQLGLLHGDYDELLESLVKFTGPNATSSWNNATEQQRGRRPRGRRVSSGNTTVVNAVPAGVLSY